MKRTAYMAVLAAISLNAGCIPGAAQPLIDYVKQPDSSYRWTKQSDEKLQDQGTQVKLELTSQTWQGFPWKHQLHITRPDNLRFPSTAVLYITGDSGDLAIQQLGLQAASYLGMPVAILYDIPNQPLFDGKTEDALIAHTFVKYIETGDKTWPLLFPMTKSVVRAMDAIQELSKAEWKDPIQHFIIIGASKRGWTTWLTGVVDSRVSGIAPIVYDNLNLQAQLKKQVDVYGSFSERISDYSMKGLPQLLQTERGRELASMVDPYAFLDRLTMPKLILNGSNDPYWTLESTSLYYNDLLGEKTLLCVPNMNHNIENRQKLQETAAAFIIRCAQNQAMPKIDCECSEESNQVYWKLKLEGSPAKVVFWVASSDTRDFRQSKWIEMIPEKKDGGYQFTLKQPEKGYLGVIGEVTYREGINLVSLSTIPKVIEPIKK